MTRTKKIVALMLAVLVLSALAFAGVASAKSNGAGGVSFTLVATNTSFEPIERGFTWTDSLQTTDGVPIDGWGGGRCLNLNPDPAVLTQHMCDMVMHLPEGDITGTMVFDIEAVDAGENFVFAVTGGAGSFRNARGEIEGVPIDELSSYVVFRLIGASANY